MSDKKLTIHEATTTTKSICLVYRENGQTRQQRCYLGTHMNMLLINGNKTLQRSQLIAIYR